MCEYIIDVYEYNIIKYVYEYIINVYECKTII